MFNRVRNFLKEKSISKKKANQPGSNNVRSGTYDVVVSNKSYIYIGPKGRLNTKLFLKITTEGEFKNEFLLLFIDHRIDNVVFRKNVADILSVELGEDKVIEPKRITGKRCKAIVEMNHKGAQVVKRITRSN